MKTEQFDGFSLTYDDSDEALKAAGQILLNWFKKEEMFSGESIHQSDVTYEDAPTLLTEACEQAFKFKCFWTE